MPNYSTAMLGLFVRVLLCFRSAESDATQPCLYGWNELMSFLRNSVAEIQANFPAIIANEFAQNPTIDAQFTTWLPNIVARLSTNLYRDSNGNVAPFLAVAATRLSAPNLVRLKAAFGVAVDAAVTAYAPAAVKASYLATPAPAILKHSHAGLAAGYIPKVNPLMDITDIWLEFYAVEGATYTTATVAAVSYAAQAGLAAAWAAGYYGTSWALAKGNAANPGQDMAWDIVSSLLGALGINPAPVYNPNPPAPTPAVTFPLPDNPPLVITPLPADDGDSPGYNDFAGGGYFICFGDDSCDAAPAP